MLLLALDTCHPDGSVAVLRDLDALQTVAHETSQDYSSWLLPAVQRALQAAGITLADVDVYAVASGPGSFTGVRVGLTTVKAWSEVYGRPIAGVSRLEALATLASSDAPYVATFADAYRGQVFGAVYDRRGERLMRVDEEMLIAPEKFLAWAAQTAGAGRVEWISPDPQCISGTESWKTRLALKEALHTVSPILAPAIGRLGYGLAMSNRLTDALSLDANYLRRSDAESWKDRSQLFPIPDTTAARALVRSLQLRDADAVEEITQRSPGAALWSRESYVALDRKGQLAWVAEADGAVCGFLVARIAANEAEILNLAVDPGKRRKGIATTLWKEAFAEFGRRGAHSAFLEVRESNHAAIDFYTRHGFTRTGLRTGYYRAPVEGAVLMMRKLTG